jgi:beta-galactosidase
MDRLAAARHSCDLRPDGRIHLHVDAAHHGLGSASCGPPVPAWHTLAAVPASFTIGLAGQGPGGKYHGPFGIKI